MDWHGDLPQEKMDQIKGKIPEINDSRVNIATNTDLSISIADHQNGTNLVGAIECLYDARKRFSQIQYSLYEALSCIIWNRDFSQEPNEKNVIFTGAYYLSYATLLMYASAEDVAWFIIHFMDIAQSMNNYFQTESGKRKLERGKLTSKAGTVGIYLRENHPGHPITNLMQNLHQNSNWDKAIEYRNRWVHDKPPSFRGGEMEFSREKKTATDSSGNTVTFLSAPTQEYSIDELLNIVIKAAEVFAYTIDSIAEIIINQKQD